MTPIQLGIVEDESLVRESLQEYLGMQPDIQIVRSAESMEEFLHYLPGIAQLDMMLLDIGLPGMSGLEGIEVLLKKRPDVDIIMLTASDDYEKIYAALQAGAISYLSKRTPLPIIKETLLTVYQGGSVMSPEVTRTLIQHIKPTASNPSSVSADSVLTPRQAEIVQGIVEGLSYKLIADKYDITLETVRDHIKKIYKKLGVNSKAEVIAKWAKGEI